MTPRPWPRLATSPRRPIGSPLPPFDGPDPSLASLPVLIIEDEAVIAWMLESLLEDMGFEQITIAADGTAALQAVTRQVPALIISDINLGKEADGIEVVASVCRDGFPPAIFISAYADEGTGKRIADQVSGARLLPKPLHSVRLAMVIREVLAKPAKH